MAFGRMSWRVSRVPIKEHWARYPPSPDSQSPSHPLHKHWLALLSFDFFRSVYQLLTSARGAKIQYERHPDLTHQLSRGLGREMRNKHTDTQRRPISRRTWQDLDSHMRRRKEWEEARREEMMGGRLEGEGQYREAEFFCFLFCNLCFFKLLTINSA